MSSCLHDGHPLQVLCKLPCGIMSKRDNGPGNLIFYFCEMKPRSEETYSQNYPTNLQESAMKQLQVKNYRGQLIYTVLYEI